MAVVAVAFAATAVSSAPIGAEAMTTDVAGNALTGCWDLRDTSAEISRRAEDPFYASHVRYCFDEVVAGEFVTRAAEFNGYKDEAGDWVNGGGDGWDGGGHYMIDGDRIRLDEGQGQTCNFAISVDVLTLSRCVADQTMGAAEPIEDTIWDRVQQ